MISHEWQLVGFLNTKPSSDMTDFTIIKRICTLAKHDMCMSAFNRVPLGVTVKMMLAKTESAKNNPSMTFACSRLSTPAGNMFSPALLTRDLRPKLALNLVHTEVTNCLSASLTSTVIPGLRHGRCQLSRRRTPMVLIKMSNSELELPEELQHGGAGTLIIKMPYLEVQQLGPQVRPTLPDLDAAKDATDGPQHQRSEGQHCASSSPHCPLLL